MGMYCCCDVKISGEEYDGKPKCSCDWEGWISTCDWPPERKNKDIPIQEQPPKSGKYLARWSNDCGDRIEDIKNYSKDIISYESMIYSDRKIAVHWDIDSDPIYRPYAWKEIT